MRPQGERSSLCAPKLAARRILDGSFAPEPSRGAGRLCPEFSKTEPSPSAIPLTRCTVAAIVLGQDRTLKPRVYPASRRTFLS